MDGDRFDRLTAAIMARGNRRTALGLLLGSAGGGTALIDWLGADARKKKKKKPCPPGTTRCGKHCVDTASDRKHCGGCGDNNKCGRSDDAACCSGHCVDLGKDVANCGGCNVICSEGEECVQRLCLDACKPNEVRCGLVCHDLQRDRNNCGQCGHACLKDPDPTTRGQRDQACLNSVCGCAFTRCANNLCCPKDWVCVGNGKGCCPSGMYSCGDAEPGRCCPVGTTCAGSCGDPCCNP